MKSPFDVIKAPIVTEKASIVGESGQVVFKVDVRANKTEIRDAVETLFECKVANVRTVNYLGKRRVRFRRLMGSEAKFKKAYVTLVNPEQTVDLLEKI